MTINEFIERFNELDMPYGETHYKISATKEESFAHGVVINLFKNNKFEVTAARLPEGVNAWDFYGGAPFSPEMLELMAELAKTPFEEREEQPKYVILNSKPFAAWQYFRIGDEHESSDPEDLIMGSYITSDPEDLIMGSYTLEELEKEKRWLPKEWRKAINSMLTPLDVALEMVKENQRGPIADNDRRIEVKKDDDLD